MIIQLLAWSKLNCENSITYLRTFTSQRWSLVVYCRPRCAFSFALLFLVVVTPICYGFELVYTVVVTVIRLTCTSLYWFLFRNRFKPDQKVIRLCRHYFVQFFACVDWHGFSDGRRFRNGSDFNAMSLGNIEAWATNGSRVGDERSQMVFALIIHQSCGWLGIGVRERDIKAPLLICSYILFVVTFRSFFRKHGHEHLWWHLGRALGAVLSLIAWFSVMPLLGEWSRHFTRSSNSYC